MRDPVPKLLILAGPNGSGKSTFAEELVDGHFGIKKYVNADTIARGLAAFDVESVGFEAGRIMITWLHRLADRREEFAFETTLASRSFIPLVVKCLRQEYDFYLCFLWLRSPELAVRRVEQRVRASGHAVTEEIVRRRYRRGIGNFFELYQPLAMRWQVLDNSSYAPRTLIAEGAGTTLLNVLQPELWRQFREAQNER